VIHAIRFIVLSLSSPRLALHILRVRGIGWRNGKQPANDITQLRAMRPVHRRAHRRGNRPGDFRADRVHLLTIGRRERRGLAPKAHKFGTADFLESVVERTGYGTHAELEGKPDAAIDLLELSEKHRKCRTAPQGVPDIRQEPIPNLGIPNQRIQNQRIARTRESRIMESLNQRIRITESRIKGSRIDAVLIRGSGRDSA
jgi:hypothetical protein